MTERLPYVPDVLSGFVDEAASLWDQWWNQRQVPEPDGDYIEKLKQRLAPTLRGAQLFRQAAWESIDEALDTSWGGEYFVGTLLALHPFDLHRFKSYVDQGVQDYVTWHALLDALLWCPDDNVKQLCTQMVRSGKPAHAALGFCALINMDVLPERPWMALMKAAKDANNPVAIRALCEYCSPEAVPALLDMVDDMDTPEKVVVSERLIHLGVSPETLPIGPLVFEVGPYRDRMLKAVFQYLGRESADQLIEILQDHPEPERSCLIAVGAAKREDMLSWVVQCMKILELRRIAGWALEQILGIDLMEKGWLDHAVELDENWLSGSRDSELNWPDINAIAAWLQTADQGIEHSESKIRVSL
ncbi:hypothetical protein [Hahella ganghwensis]|uniref:hypothetical protein n=1 Tax=Hahella ganghwensis TaxID=286420 RepID=UPI00037F449B|nr:hypothetical protein [Hahella ganghwensis]